MALLACPSFPAPPVIYGDWMFLISDRGIGTCVEHATGRVVWQERIGGNRKAGVLGDFGLPFPQGYGIATAKAALMIDNGTSNRYILIIYFLAEIFRHRQ